MSQHNNYDASDTELARFDAYYAECFPTVEQNVKHRSDGTTRELAAYLRGVLDNKGWSVQDLSRRLGYRTPLHLHAVLTGQFPTDEITPEFIERLSQAIDCDASVIRILLDLPLEPNYTTPQQAERHLSALEEEQENLLNDLLNSFLEVLDQRYSQDITSRVEQNRYDFVIKQFESIVSKTRDAKRRMDQLKALLEEEMGKPDEPTEVLSHTQDTPATRRYQAHLLDIHRIIQHIKERV